MKTSGIIAIALLTVVSGMALYMVQAQQVGVRRRRGNVTMTDFC